MSAFLGPVHQWMYKKIQFQETFTTRLLGLSADNALARQLTQKWGAVDTQPLEQIIDQGNIHGWLSQRVQRAEERFADAVEALLAQPGQSLPALTALACQLGQEQALPTDASIGQARQAVTDLLLDGMPCDGASRIVSEDADELCAQYDVAAHLLCNRGEAGTVAFCALREALLTGLLTGTKLRLVPLGPGSYKLTREG